MRREDQERALEEVISRVVAGVADRGGHALEAAVADTLYYENQRLKQAKAGKKRDQERARYAGYRSGLLRGSDHQRKRILREIVTAFAREVLGNFEHVLPGDGPTRRSVKALALDTEGALWIGYEGGGLTRYRAADGSSERFTPDPTIPGSISDDHIEALLVDGAGRLWVGTRGGLDLRRPQQDGFEHFRHQPYDPNSLANNHVRTLMEDRSGLTVGHPAMASSSAATRSRWPTM